MTNIAFKIDPLVVWNAHFAIRAHTGTRPHVGAKLEQYVCRFDYCYCTSCRSFQYLISQYTILIPCKSNKKLIYRIQKYTFIFLERSMHF